MYDVAVIGAGAAGISAARKCRERGLTCIVLEAAGAVGGRATTIESPDGSKFDRGAHWLHSPALNPLSKYVAADAPPLADAFAKNGSLYSVDEVVRCEASIDAFFAVAEARGKDGIDEVVGDSVMAGSVDGAAFEIAFTNKLGVPPDRGSTLDIARYVWEGDDIPVIQGMGSLVTILADGLDIRCGHAVTTIDYRAADRVFVSGEWGRVEARKAVITISTGVLRSGSIRFLPELPASYWEAIEGLPMGSCNKLWLSFRRQVFDEMPPSMLVPLDDPREAMEIVLREGGLETATGLFHGPFGRALAADGEGAMREHLVSVLAKIFGSDIHRYAEPTRIFVDWDSDPNIRGYVSAALPGCADARVKLAEPLQNRLAFAGEATSLCFMGDVHGAWLEGEAAIARFFS